MAASSPVVDFSEMADDFQRLTAEIVYCTVTTVDERHRPRSRVLHPIFEVVDGEPQGWAVTDRTPVKVRHLAANPHVACFYWSPAQNTVSIDCVASWATDDAERRHAWALFAAPPPSGLGRHVGLRSRGHRSSGVPCASVTTLARSDPAGRAVRGR